MVEFQSHVDDERNFSQRRLETDKIWWLYQRDREVNVEEAITWSSTTPLVLRSSTTT